MSTSSHGRILMIEHLDPTFEPEVAPETPAGFELVLTEPWNEAEQIRLAADADYIIAGGVPVTAAVIDAAPRLRLIQKLGIGVDKIDLVAAARRGVPVAITAGANAGAVAEGTFLLMLAVSRHVLEADASIRAGTWIRPEVYTSCYELMDRTIGLVGFGNIGRAVARRARAFEMQTLYYDRVRPPADVERELGATYAPLDVLLRESDIVSIHVPWTHDTHHLIGEGELALMKSSAIIINTARGEVIDEGALTLALQQGRLRGAGLDVLEREPIRERRPIFELPNTVFMPHIAGMTRDTRRRLWRHAFRNIARLAAGGRLDDADIIDAEASSIVPAR